MKSMFQDSYKQFEKELDGFVNHFSTTGTPFGNQDRNSLKLFELQGETINIKSFKIPNIINQIAYKFFRKSKAQRSFEYANVLMKKSIGTPQPIAYYEFETPFAFKKSFYISEQLEVDLTYRELCHDLNYPEHEKILRGFTRFTYELHEKQIHFLDHSPGNTLIKKEGDHYNYYLVDLNRMNFGPMDFETRMKNFSRLTVHESMVRTMSEEYSKCSGESADRIFQAMWQYTQEFQDKFHRKKALKKKLKFWKR